MHKRYLLILLILFCLSCSATAHCSAKTNEKTIITQKTVKSKKALVKQLKSLVRKSQKKVRKYKIVNYEVKANRKLKITTNELSVEGVNIVQSLSRPTFECYASAGTGSYGKYYYYTITLYPYTEKQMKYIEKVTNPVLSSCKGKTKLEQIRICYEWVKNRYTYDMDNYNAETMQLISPDYSYDIYESLKRNLSVCSGYAETMRYLLSRLNIQCDVLESKQHAWNRVYYQGKWYECDVCWGDIDNLSESYKYFMISPKAMQKYDYHQPLKIYVKK